MLRQAAEECVELTLLSVRAEGWLSSADPCEDEPILFPAGTARPLATPEMEMLNAYEAAEHDLDAIASHPQWVQLNYMNGTSAKPKQVPEQWYKRAAYSAGCAAKAAGQQCDEYPFYATTQGGPKVMGGDGASLRVIKESQNKAEGTAYRAMVGRCGLQSAAPVPTGTTAAGGSPFLVIPLPRVAVPSFYLCQSPSSEPIDVGGPGAASGGGGSDSGGGGGSDGDTINN